MPDQPEKNDLSSPPPDAASRRVDPVEDMDVPEVVPVARTPRPEAPARLSLEDELRDLENTLAAPEDEAADASTPPPPGLAAPAPRPVPEKAPAKEMEAWVPQQREARRPDFAERLAKTSDLPATTHTKKRKAAASKHFADPLQWDNAKQAARKSRGALARWQVLMLLGLVGLNVLLLAAWGIKGLFLQNGAASRPAPVAAPAPAEAPIEATLTSGEVDDAVTITRNFLQAATLADAMPFVRELARVRPLMEAYYQDTPWQPFEVRRMPEAVEQFQTNFDLLATVVEVNDYQPRIVALQKTPEGPRLDWEAFVGYCEVPWEKLGEMRPVRPFVMRVRLAADDYFNFDFTDPSRYVCCRLSSMDERHSLYGYVVRNTPLYTALLSRLRLNSVPMPTIRVRFQPGGASTNQVEIVELLADGWVVTENTRITSDSVQTPGSPSATPTPSPGGPAGQPPEQQ